MTDQLCLFSAYYLLSFLAEFQNKYACMCVWVGGCGWVGVGGCGWLGMCIDGCGWVGGWVYRWVCVNGCVWVGGWVGV